MNAHQLFLYLAASRSGPLTLTFYLGERSGDDIALRVEVRAPSWLNTQRSFALEGGHHLAPLNGQYVFH